MEFLFNILYRGLLLGIFLAVLVGPLLVAIVQAGIEGGRREGFKVAIGIWISDLLILIAMFALRDFLAQILNQTFIYIFGICGALILFAIAWKNLSGKSALLKKKQVNYSNGIKNLITGFLINTINPFTFFFWSGVVMYYGIKERYTSNQVLLLLFTILFVIIFTDSLKVIFAGFLQKQLKSGALHIVQKVSGIVFLIFGLVLLWRIFFTEIELGALF